MNNIWRDEFRGRMRRFGVSKNANGEPLSIKVRITSGCFHREHSPKAYDVIDAYLTNDNFDNENFEFLEHESGPEILVYLAVTAAGLGFAKSIVELVTTIIKARSEGIKKGDVPDDPLELIVRGHGKDGEYFEETLLRIPAGQDVKVGQIERLLKAFAMNSKMRLGSPKKHPSKGPSKK